MSPSDDTSTDNAASLTLTTLSDLYREGTAALSAVGIQNARSEAMWILEFALGLPVLKIQTEGQTVVAPEGRERARRLFARRTAREPLQYLLGAQEFCGLEFHVEPGVLIPRPETELLVEEVTRHDFAHRNPILADIGTGSGCIAIAIARGVPAASVYATDRSPSALRVARRNAARLQAADRITFLGGDLFEPLAQAGLNGRLAAVVSNPPYIADVEFASLMPEVGQYEPRLALAGGEDGLAVHRRILKESPAFLVAGGLLVLETGRGQAAALRAMAAAHGGYRHLRTRRDSAGIERVVCFRWEG